MEEEGIFPLTTPRCRMLNNFVNYAYEIGTVKNPLLNKRKEEHITEIVHYMQSF